MNGKRPRRLGRAWLAVSVWAIARSALAGNSISSMSQPGDTVGQGQSASYTDANGTFFARSGGYQGVYISFNHGTPPGVWWSVDFAAPYSARLAPGAYPNAQL